MVNNMDTKRCKVGIVSVLDEVIHELGYREVKKEQKDAIKPFVNGEDVVLTDWVQEVAVLSVSSLLLMIHF